MAKIVDYPKVTTVDDANVFLMDGDSGTKGILAKNLILGLLGRLTSKEINGKMPITGLDAYTYAAITDSLVLGSSSVNKRITVENFIWSALDGIATVEMRRNIFRGKKLGTAVTAAQYEVINSGAFTGFFLGDYWEIGGRIYRIADFDYWYKKGNPICSTHHLVIVPDSYLADGVMNDTATAVGGYANSKARSIVNSTVATIINGAFTSSHILSHREYLINGISDEGFPTLGAWYDSKYELLSEEMLYGHFMFNPAHLGSFKYSDHHSISSTQLALFKIHPYYINVLEYGFWLRDVSSPNDFSVNTYAGTSGGLAANQSAGYRVVFGIKK